MTRLFCLVLLLASAAVAQDVLVVAPKEFQRALGPWRRQRAKQGHDVVVRTPRDDMRGLVKEVHAASKGKLRFVLLLGDVKYVPCGYVACPVLKPYERDWKRVATDNLTADVDGDMQPDVAIGRLPADSWQEAAALLARALAYEANDDYGPWRRRINVIAGVGGFGLFQDMALEQVTAKFLKENVPETYDLHVTYGNPSSPFCPPPGKIKEITLERFNEGALFVTYLGHGSPRRLDAIRYKGRVHRILEEDDLYSLESRHGAPIAFFVACSTGHFDGAPDCLAEIAVKRPAGPIAVIAASRVSMPYANAVVAKEVLEAALQDRCATLGEAFLQAKRRLVPPRHEDEGRKFIDFLAMGYKWRETERAAERAEHLHLYNLIGDPTLRLPHPAVAEVTCAEQAAPGAKLAVTVATPVAGGATIELVEERTPVRPARTGDDEADFARCYALANAWVRAETTATVGGKPVTAALEIPDDAAPGRYLVRVYVTGKGGAAAGVRAITIRAK
jgi:hypothetical protein